MGRPHVVVLGAGASRAACLNGDRNGNILPLMQYFTQVLGLEPLLNGWGINTDQNFEEIFSGLYEQQKNESISQIEEAVEQYFDKLELPDKPTIYDHLVLSLRETDLIATFNWDPLLMRAYLRNNNSGLKLPKLAFLHGNIRVGYCEKDKIKGLAYKRCKYCGELYKPAPLLYPIKKKNYARDLFIANEWELLKWGFENAFMITIFGYSGPKTDQEAIAAMKEAWGNKYLRSMEQTAFITTQSENEICENWDQFIHTHHYEIHDDFYNSWIANHPRRTGEAYLNQHYDIQCISNNPIPRDLDFPELWKWYEKFKTAEDAERRRYRRLADGPRYRPHHCITHSRPRLTNTPIPQSSRFYPCDIKTPIVLLTNRKDYDILVVTLKNSALINSLNSTGWLKKTSWLCVFAAKNRHLSAVGGIGIRRLGFIALVVWICLGFRN